MQRCLHKKTFITKNAEKLTSRKKEAHTFVEQNRNKLSFMKDDITYKIEGNDP